MSMRGVSLATSLLLLVSTSTWSYVLLPTTTNPRSSQRLSGPSVASKKKCNGSLNLKNNNNGDKKKNGNNDNNKNKPPKDEEDNDFSTFLDGLQLWPQFNNDGGDSTEKAQAAKSSSRYRGVNPLGNIFNVEALLKLATSLNSNETGTVTDTGTNTSTADRLPNVLPDTGRLFGLMSEQEEQATATASSLSNVTTVEEFMAWEKWMENIQKTIVPSLSSTTSASTSTSSTTTTDTKELKKQLEETIQEAKRTTKDIEGVQSSFFRDATNRIEYLVGEASTATASVQDLLIRASRASPNDIVRAAEGLARDRGLNVQQATERARETTRYAANMVAVANILYGAGYAVGSKVTAESSPLETTTTVPESKPLFAEFASARAVTPAQYGPIVGKGAEMGSLSGAIYEDTVEKCHELGHSLVANGTTEDVAWLVTDSIGYEEDYAEIGFHSPKPTGSKNKNKNNNNNKRPIFIRTITLRGFDASDETVDRERLLNTICSATGTVMDAEYPDILFHSGLLVTARKIYKELIKYVDWASPNHKLVLNGHSIGGSLSILLLFLMTIDRGVEFVEERILRAYAFGSPPVAVKRPYAVTRDKPRKRKKSSSAGTGDITYDCEILEAFGLQSSMVYGYIQPWDPVVRFLTEYDALYPLVDDLGKDGVTLYSNGPPRSLRPVTKALFQSWEGWPRFRENWKSTNQNFQCVGIQHMLLPEPLRYLNDRFVSVNIGVPPTDSIVRIASRELLPALAVTFPMDVFQISYIPQAVRSFLHHFFPAYDFTIANYAAKVAKQTRTSEKKQKGENSEITFESSNGLKSSGPPLGWGKTQQRGAPSPVE